MSQPHVTVSLVRFFGSEFVEVRVHDVIDNKPLREGSPIRPHTDHLVLIEPVMVDGKGDGFHCRSNVDCAFGDTVETAFEAYIDRAKSANRSRVGFQAVVIDTIVPALEAHHDAIISQATTLLAD